MGSNCSACFPYIFVRALRNPVFQPKSFPGETGAAQNHMPTTVLRYICSIKQLFHWQSGGKLDLLGESLVLLSLDICIYQGAKSWKVHSRAQRFWVRRATPRAEGGSFRKRRALVPLGLRSAECQLVFRLLAAFSDAVLGMTENTLPGEEEQTREVRALDKLKLPRG